MSLHLPDRPNLDLLKRQAKVALRVGRLLHPSWRLADAQRALATGYGLASWTDLKHSVAAKTRPARLAPSAGVTHRQSAELETASPAGATRRFVGSWISCSTNADRVALEIDVVGGALQFTQVVAGAGGKAVAGSLLIRVDGREHQLPVGDRLHSRAMWSGEQTIQTIVTRDGVTVAEGTYAVSDDGHTLIVTAPAQRFVFARMTSERPPTGDRPSRVRSQMAPVIILAATLLASGCASASKGGAASTPARREPASDIRAIEALNRHDIAAAMATDVDAIVSQWTEDFVLLPPAGPVIRGRDANAAMIAAARHQFDTFEPLAYDVNFVEIVVAGDYAFAWGQFRAAARPRAGGNDIVSNGKLLRIYQRQADGRWLMHRTISTMDSPRQ